ncbi:MAG TPA: hypothetical protein VM733_18850 [Thermoanaerobaculia bacterium]|nr:hypothetical protein [Thermoanaerobaculia bacterium]
MEEQNEILAAIRKLEERFDGIDGRFDGIDKRFDGIDERFDGIDERFDGIDKRFDGIDKRFGGVDKRFNSVDQQFATIRREFAEQLDGVSNGFHVEMGSLKKLIVQKANEARVADEGLHSRIDLLTENVANVAREIGRYHTAVEVPHEQRVNSLEARVFKLEQKMGGTEAKSRRRS